MPPNAAGTASRGKDLSESWRKTTGATLPGGRAVPATPFRDSSPNFELRKPDDVPIFTLGRVRRPPSKSKWEDFDLWDR